MKVVDIYSGAGGFSEGFRQAGFQIIFGIDKWEPAVLTHQSNHPKAITLLDDVIRVSLLPDNDFEAIVPDSEIIIGSPPCVSFSNSNKSGKTDKSEGISLLMALFRIVARKKWKENSILKYWIMENVPNSRKYIKDFYTAKDLGLRGTNILYTKNESSNIFDAAYFSVTSRRKRYFCGDFPEPIRTVQEKKDIVHLREVLDALGPPNSKVDDLIYDPNYNFVLPGFGVTDHHYEKKLARYQWKNAKRLKRDKGYMGKMAFPEDLNRPARTIMATLTLGARESMIFGNGKGSYRAPTIREVASLMSFPIDYKFYGESIGLKYRLVGNAVSPKMAYAFAKAILVKENIKLPERYEPIQHSSNGKFFDLNGKKYPLPKEKPRHIKSRFKYHIPYLILDSFRVELTNHYSDFDKESFLWDVEIHRSQGPRARVYKPSAGDISLTNLELKKIDEFLNSLRKNIVGYNEFQEIYCKTFADRKSNKLIGPFEFLEIVKSFVDDWVTIEVKPVKITLDKDRDKLPRKIAVGYLVLKSFCNEMGRLSP